MLPDCVQSTDPQFIWEHAAWQLNWQQIRNVLKNVLYFTRATRLKGFFSIIPRIFLEYSKTRYSWNYRKWLVIDYNATFKEFHLEKKLVF